MTICERVYFHNSPQSSFTSSNLNQAILRTCQELAIAGFTEAAKEQNKEAAEKIYEDLFKAVHIWDEYQDKLVMLRGDWQEKNEKEKREHQIERSFIALEDILTVKLRDEWQYSLTKRFNMQ